MRPIELDYFPYLQRYKNGEWRSTIFRDMILTDAAKFKKQGNELSILDIGCGGGFDSDDKLQYSLSKVAGRYIGVEPDEQIELGSMFDKIYRCPFEKAQIESESIDMAFAVMVLEHFERPKIFWEKLHSILKKGGVFWGFTVDARHWFVFASLLAEKMHIKDYYLNKLHGKRGEDRYENYGVFYRSNTPKVIKKLTPLFKSKLFLNFHRVGQMDYYFPKNLRWFSKALDVTTIKLGLPGSILAVRVEK